MWTGKLQISRKREADMVDTDIDVCFDGRSLYYERKALITALELFVNYILRSEHDNQVPNNLCS